MTFRMFHQTPDFIEGIIQRDEEHRREKLREDLCDYIWLQELFYIEHQNRLELLTRKLGVDFGQHDIHPDREDYKNLLHHRRLCDEARVREKNILGFNAALKGGGGGGNNLLMPLADWKERVNQADSCREYLHENPECDRIEFKVQEDAMDATVYTVANRYIDRAREKLVLFPSKRRRYGKRVGVFKNKKEEEEEEYEKDQFSNDPQLLSQQHPLDGKIFQLMQENRRLFGDGATFSCPESKVL